MFSIGKFLGHDEKFYDLLEASAQEADSSVHHLIDLLAKMFILARAVAALE